MSSGSNAGKKEKSKVFDMLLASPGMQERCKVVLHMNRQNLLLLSRLIETCLLNGELKTEDEFLQDLPGGAADEFKQIHQLMLQKSGLTDFYEKLKSL